MDERDEFRRRKIFENTLGIFKLFDPLGITDVIKHIREDRFYIEERFRNMRNRLKSFIDQLTEFFGLDYFSDKFFTCIYKIFNNLLTKTYQIEIDFQGVKKMIFKLYPIRKLLNEHSKVIDVLSRY
ncbi:MAG: hypothetical protein ACTSO9_15360 [Candidatus Helarchaeota archaeon]